MLSLTTINLVVYKLYVYVNIYSWKLWHFTETFSVCRDYPLIIT